MRSCESVRRRAQARPRSGRERMPCSGWVELGLEPGSLRSGRGLDAGDLQAGSNGGARRDPSPAPSLPDAVNGKAALSPEMALRIGPVHLRRTVVLC